jgi:mono/diheme cytochrome c family protein
MQRVNWMVTAGLMVACLGAAQAADNKLPEGEGKQVTERVCGACHGIDSVVSERHNKGEWQKVVDDMASRGADATDAELKQIVEYLTKYFGPKASSAK